MPLYRLLPDARAVHKDFEGSCLPLFAVVGHDQSYGTVRIQGYVEGEPFLCAAAATSRRGAGRGLFALLIEIPFSLRLARLRETDRRRFTFAAPLLFGGDLRGFLLPFRGREEVPIDGIDAPVQAVKRHEFHILLAPNAVTAEIARLARYPLEPFRQKPFPR